MSALLRLVRLATFIGIGTMTVTAADAATVTGTFRYLDTTSPACQTGSPSSCLALQPIAFANVEVWHRGTLPWNFWVPVASTATNALGQFSFSDTRGDGTYAVRVYASNYAAAALLGSNVTFYAEPGFPGPAFNRSVTSPTQVVNFSFNFTDATASMFYNVAETVRRGFDFAAARRQPGDPDALPRANIVVTSLTGNPANVSWYNPAAHTVVLSTSDATRDFTILHEYGHWLEAQLSSFAWIASSHDGCTARDVFGNIINSPEHAWMEGFATYFARSVASLLPAGTLSGTTAQFIENPATCSTSAGDAVEDFVAATLWDLSDSGINEPHDFVSGSATTIFQIFDKELDVFGTSPTIWHFRNAWMARGRDRAGLDRIMSRHGMLSLPNQTAQVVSTSVPAQMVPGQTYTASVRMRNTGVTTWSAASAHRLGSQNPQDNLTWGIHRVNLPTVVAPGASVTVTFSVTAPAAPGNYNFRWRMVQDGVEWFGDFTPNVVVSVASTSPDIEPDLELCFDPEIKKYVPCP
jgi:Ig-like domain from next to BRCA1 gene